MRKQKAEESVNTEWVERTAVNRLESALLSTGLVVPTIPTGDKGPSWDGEIRLYSVTDIISLKVSSWAGFQSR